eukprot:jgi/Chlat1/4018/Chrsp26S00298
MQHGHSHGHSHSHGHGHRGMAQRERSNWDPHWDGYDDEGFCVGVRCRGLEPEAENDRKIGYGPPRAYRWKVTARCREGVTAPAQPQLTVRRSWSLPQALGLNSNGTWRWPFLPVSLQVGGMASMRFPSFRDWRGGDKHDSDLLLNGNSHSTNHHDTDSNALFVTKPFGNVAVGSGAGTVSVGGVSFHPSVRIKFERMVGMGDIGVRPVLELLPVPVVSIKRVVRVGPVGITLRGSWQISRDNAHKPLFSVEVDWQPVEFFRVYRNSGNPKLVSQFEKPIPVDRRTTAVFGGHIELPVVAGRRPTLEGEVVPHDLKLDLIRSGSTFRTAKALRLQAKEYHDVDIMATAGTKATRNMVAIVPGHWIDPEDDTGAPGERNFNMEVANRVTTQLSTSGWRVLRPDRDAPTMQWDDYLDWISAQAARGVPTVEIHGQGASADYRGIVKGVIGTQRSQLHQALANEFGFYPMDWRELAVPRRGGGILEAFDTDEVSKLSVRQRSALAAKLARKISRSVQKVARQEGAFENIRKTATEISTTYRSYVVNSNKHQAHDH